VATVAGNYDDQGKGDSPREERGIALHISTFKLTRARVRATYRLP
jgi:hypothetical protein